MNTKMNKLLFLIGIISSSCINKYATHLLFFEYDKDFEEIKNEYNFEFNRYCESEQNIGYINDFIELKNEVNNLMDRVQTQQQSVIFCFYIHQIKRLYGFNMHFYMSLSICV